MGSKVKSLQEHQVREIFNNIAAWGTYTENEVKQILEMIEFRTTPTHYHFELIDGKLTCFHPSELPLKAAIHRTAATINRLVSK